MSDSPPPDADEALRALADTSAAAPDPVDLEAQPASSPHVDRDIGCLGCDYNLRGLPVDGTCPECGHSVGVSLRASLIWRVDLRVLVKARLGARMMWLSVALLIVTMFLAVAQTRSTPFRLFAGAAEMVGVPLIVGLAGLGLSVVVVMTPVSVGVRRGILADAERLPRAVDITAYATVAPGLGLVAISVVMLFTGHGDRIWPGLIFAGHLLFLASLLAVFRLNLFAHLLHHRLLQRGAKVIFVVATMCFSICPMLACATDRFWPVPAGWFAWWALTALEAFVFDARLSEVIAQRRQGESPSA